MPCEAHSFFWDWLDTFGTDQDTFKQHSRPTNYYHCQRVADRLQSWHKLPAYRAAEQHYGSFHWLHKWQRTKIFSQTMFWDLLNADRQRFQVFLLAETWIEFQLLAVKWGVLSESQAENQIQATTSLLPSSNSQKSCLFGKEGKAHCARGGGIRKSSG